VIANEKGVIIPEAILALSRLNLEYIASPFSIPHALANLPEVHPPIIIYLGEHLDQQLPERFSTPQMDDSLFADVWFQQRHAFGLDPPFANFGLLHVLLDKHLDAAMHEFDPLSFVLGENVAC